MRRGAKSCSANRVRVILAVISFFWILVVYKLFTVQVLQNSYWSKQAQAQQNGKRPLPSSRGEILASDGFKIAQTSFIYDLFIDPSKVNSDSFAKDIEQVANIIFSENEEKQQFISLALEKTKDKSRMFEYLHKGLDQQVKLQIENLNISYIGFLPTPSRLYPNEEVFSHILGIVGQNENGEAQGYFGLEGYYNGNLSGIDGIQKGEISAGGAPLLYSGISQINKVDGANLQTTIDRTVQSMAYNAIKEGVKKYKAESGVIVIVNPKSGDVLAMANYPSFNPKDYAKHYTDDPTIFVNKAVSSTYEPGSVIKALTMAGAIDKGVVSKNSTMVDSGPVYYSGHKVDNWDGKHHGEINMTQILQLSNNIGASYVGERLGSKNLYKYFTDFGLGKKLGVDLEGEEAGLLRDYNKWEDIDLVAASFGQGILATPLQVTMAFAAIANDGILMTPNVVKGLDYGEGLVEFPKQQGVRVISSQTASIMSQMLTDAVSGGEAKYFVSKTYNIAGKTGTAQIAEKGEYLKDKTNATFVGFLPKYSEFVMLVKLEKPTASVYASETAVPLWMDVAERLASYYGLPPDKYE